ncbi:TPA: 50S ribosomal protein L15 [Candidatus Woesearchaeota archaeon]|nr:50S ribosomal protein L15 [Candidatus Woesearchaeota archaeon]
MAVHKRKKNTRQRGSHTHGWGAMKKHRGAGSRGGRGRSGSGKRGDQKKPRYWKTEQSGKLGFVPRSSMPKISPINLRTVEDVLPTWEKRGLVKKQGGVFAVDLGALGYNKLLAAGKISSKLKITVDYASARAVDKVKQAGGEVEVLAGDVWESASGDDSGTED